MVRQIARSAQERLKKNRHEEKAFKSSQKKLVPERFFEELELRRQRLSSEAWKTKTKT